MTTTHPAITSFLGSAKPTFCYEIYRKDGQIYGHKIDWKHHSLVVRDYPCVHDLAGRSARYILVADDASITRQDAISFARQVHENKFRLLSVDLTHVSKSAK